MSLYWITECIPYAITSLLPVILYPMFGIMSSKQTSAIYFQDILMLYFGGLVLATCVETSGLHKRIAFKIIMLFGSNPVWLLLGMMTVTSFLSLW
jgi:di/tricarboxylate transporter